MTPDAVKEIRRRVPDGLDLLVEEDHETHDTIVFVLHGSLMITVINASADYEDQIKRDTCDAHNAFVCPSCFSDAYNVLEPNPLG